MQISLNLLLLGSMFFILGCQENTEVSSNDATVNLDAADQNTEEQEAAEEEIFSSFLINTVQDIQLLVKQESQTVSMILELQPLEEDQEGFELVRAVKNGSKKQSNKPPLPAHVASSNAAINVQVILQASSQQNAEEKTSGADHRKFGTGKFT